MRLLLDTQILLFALEQPDRLSVADAAIISEGSNDVLFSVASIWEIGIKATLKRPDFNVDPEQILANARLDFRELSISSADALRAAALPPHHRDPFDRMLVAQASAADASLMTTDKLLQAYGPHVMLVP